MDAWTAEALNNWVRIVKDDRRIAAYLALPLKDVTAARKRLPRYSREPPKPAAVAANAKPATSSDKFAIDARKGSRQLAEAIKRCRSTSP